MGGYYKMHRGWMDNPIFKPERYTEREAWLWMIERANFATKQFRSGSQLLEIPRGSFASHYRTMGVRWGWDHKRVARFLSMLEKQDMIRLETPHQCIHITICNYEKYQEVWDENAPQEPHESPSKAPQKGTKRIKGNKINNAAFVAVEDVTVEIVADWAAKNITAPIDFGRELKGFKRYVWKKGKPKDGAQAFRNWLEKAEEFYIRDHPPGQLWYETPANRMPSPAGG